MHIFDTTLAAVEARSANDETHLDMIEQWQQQYATHRDQIDEREIVTAAVSNMGAGADPASAVLQAFFYYLLRDAESLKLCAMRSTARNCHLYRRTKRRATNPSSSRASKRPTASTRPSASASHASRPRLPARQSAIGISPPGIILSVNP